MGKGKGKPPRPNDQRSNAFNPTSAEFKATTDNRANQMNSNNPSYLGSRGSIDEIEKRFERLEVRFRRMERAFEKLESE